MLRRNNRLSTRTPNETRTSVSVFGFHFAPLPIKTPVTREGHSKKFHFFPIDMPLVGFLGRTVSVTSTVWQYCRLVENIWHHFEGTIVHFPSHFHRSTNVALRRFYWLRTNEALLDIPTFGYFRLWEACLRHFSESDKSRFLGFDSPTKFYW